MWFKRSCSVWSAYARGCTEARLGVWANGRAPSTVAYARGLRGSSFGLMGKRSCSVLKSATHPAVLLVVSSAPPAPKGTCSAARPP